MSTIDKLLLFGAGYIVGSYVGKYMDPVLYSLLALGMIAVMFCVALYSVYRKVRDNDTDTDR